MRALGLNCAANTIYLVTLEDGKILEDDPLRLGMPDLEAASTQLRAFISTFGSALIDLAVERIGLVLPESTYQTTYKQLADRAAAETLIRLSALEQQVRFERLTRQRVRAALKLGQAGSLSSLVEKVVSAGKEPYWRQGRDLAAVAAFAVVKL